MTSSSLLDLTGRRIVVTGGAGGIGAATARFLANAGAAVAISDLSQDALDAAIGPSGANVAIAANVCEEAAVVRLFDAAANALGGIDGVVNNAGIMEPIRGTRKQELGDWRRVIDVNLQGVFLIAREAARRMESGGAIVNTASVAGLTAFPASNAYGVSKAAVVMLTKTLACDLARFGVRVNAVAPGVIAAPMAGQLMAEGPRGQEVFRRRIPLARLGDPVEVAAAIGFLLSDLASYVTGTVLAVDGGWTAFGGAGDAAAA